MLEYCGKVIADWKGTERVSRAMTQEGSHLIGTSGTVTCLAGVHLKLDRYRRDKVDGSWMSREEADAAVKLLRDLGLDGRATLPTIGEERASLMLSGCSILQSIWDAFPGDRLRVGDRGLREGLLLSMMYGGKSPRKRGTRRRSGRNKSADAGSGPAKDGNSPTVEGLPMTDDEKRRWKGPSDKRGTSGRRMGERKIIAHRAKNESSKRWMRTAQLQDPYVQKARSEGYRARAAYKLLEIEEKLHLFRRGQRVVDLGCAPGGWLQVAGIKGASELAGIDLLPVEPLAGVHIVQGDINEPGDVAELMKGLTGPPDLVLSDMAANTTGHKQTDHLRTVALVEMAAGFRHRTSRAGADPFVLRFFRAVQPRKCWTF